MTINRAIELEEKSVERIERIAGVFEQYGDPKQAEGFRITAAEHKELAEWLKGFKEYFGVEE